MTLEKRPGTYSEGYEHGLAAKQAEVDRMSRQLGGIQAENRRLRQQNDDLRKQVAQLLKTIHDHNSGEMSITIPSG